MARLLAIGDRPPAIGDWRFFFADPSIPQQEKHLGFRGRLFRGKPELFRRSAFSDLFIGVLVFSAFSAGFLGFLAGAVPIRLWCGKIPAAVV